MPHTQDALQPVTSRSDQPTCEFKLYPNADEVEFCEHPATYVATAPCCPQTTLLCPECMKRMPQLRFWQCHGCGRRTNAPMPLSVLPL